MIRDVVVREAGAKGRGVFAEYGRQLDPGDILHPEADFVQSYAPRSVLDAGCGTGRVAIELAGRSIPVVGVDLDPAMIERARRNAPHLEWRLGDLATVQLGRKFDAVLMAGNVMTFLERGTEQAVLKNMAAHLRVGGLLITGFQISMAYLDLDDYDRFAKASGLKLVERYSYWDRAPWRWNSFFAVSVHRST